MVLILWSSYKFHAVLHKVPLRRLLMLDSRTFDPSVTHGHTLHSDDAGGPQGWNSPASRIKVPGRPHIAEETPRGSEAHPRCLPISSMVTSTTATAGSPRGQKLLHPTLRGSWRAASRSCGLSAALSWPGQGFRDGHSSCEGHPGTNGAPCCKENFSIHFHCELRKGRK